LARDRIADNPEERLALQASIHARGQQTPVEVVDLGKGRNGLISGWRRLRALTTLREETGDERFATVQALLRRPDGAASAYLAMVEENEIRVGLGHYERAQIAARAVEQGVYPGLEAALNRVYQNVSRVKRSRIRSFVTVYQTLNGSLRFPAAPPERVGLSLAQALEADAGLADRMKTAFARNAPATAAEEQRIWPGCCGPQGRGGGGCPCPPRRCRGTRSRHLAAGCDRPARRALHFVRPGRRRRLQRASGSAAEDAESGVNVSRTKHFLLQPAPVVWALHPAPPGRLPFHLSFSGAAMSGAFSSEA
jgi:hypothetical protein